MKKIITPIIYLLFFVPAFSLTLFTIVTYERFFGLRTFFGRLGNFEGCIIFLLITIIVMYLGNFLIQKIESNKHPKLADHFRLSSLYYIIFLFSSFSSFLWYKQYPISECKTNCHGYAIIALSVLIPLVAILVNGFYLYQRRDNNIIKK
ncbi:MAG: hypothetical protein US58_C0025G0002 [Candidatus Magasanikbacteria bacterium GW2011_GWA2_37_8]|uniref:Uncharacterized protein n=1 Tax=Candidatus Magasanikbacteria bacterium GW2011_GWA2_37_8 TaxID=1619036 RepID=A0A0G0H9G4_9BACT|nr:MAG: hypothetical protein US58_C0025G0002 [Candidatus Magasanikbacteria bacterium GW2011_GWA2_37_8]